MKITAIYSMGECHYLILPDGMVFSDEMAKREKWHKIRNLPAFRSLYSEENPEFISAVEWLLRNGAVRTSIDIFHYD